MVIYSVATSGATVIGPDGQRVNSASVGQLFMAGVIPGLMLATMLGMTTWYRAWRNDYPRMQRATWAERLVAFREVRLGIAADRSSSSAASIPACSRRPKRRR